MRHGVTLKKQFFYGLLFVNLDIHPLLYMKTMGQKEQTIISDYTFDTVSIFKPGMLIRFPENKTFFERIFESNGSGLNVDLLASAMIQDAEKVISISIKDSKRFFIGNDSIKNINKN